MLEGADMTDSESIEYLVDHDLLSLQNMIVRHPRIIHKKVYCCANCPANSNRRASFLEWVFDRCFCTITSYPIKVKDQYKIPINCPLKAQSDGGG